MEVSTVADFLPAGSKPPFLALPLKQDFLGILLEMVQALQQTGNGGVLPNKQGFAERVTILFPHERPRRYVKERLRRMASAYAKPLPLPAMFTVREAMARSLAEWQAQEGKAMLPEVPHLESVALAREAVLSVQKAAGGGLFKASSLAWEVFFGWGEKLVAFLEECDRQHVRIPLTMPWDFAPDTPYAEEHAGLIVSAMPDSPAEKELAATLCQHLGAIQRQYHILLAQHGYTSPGLMAHACAEYAQNTQTLPPFLGHSRLILAGFVAPTATESGFFHRLWVEGAHVLMHTDAFLPQHSFTCAQADPHVAWAKAWQADVHSLASETAGEAGQPFGANFQPDIGKINFFSGYDAHSELACMQADAAPLLAQQNATLPEGVSHTGDTFPHFDALMAFILPDPALLTPLLHYLPVEEVNISMGYPLARSRMARLIEILLSSMLSCKNGLYGHRYLSHFLHHPFIYTLSILPLDTAQALPEQPEAGEKPLILGDFLLPAEKLLQEGAPKKELAILVDALRAAALEAENAEKAQAWQSAADFLATVLDICFKDWEAVQTLAQMAQALRNLAVLLHRHASFAQNRPSLDSEVLYYIWQTLVPALEAPSLMEAVLSRTSLAALVRRLLEAGRVPFEAEPLTGVQVLGPLEARLLRFKHVFFLDMEDTVWPASPAPDPLVPETLRLFLGLPPALLRENLMAHTFYGILAPCESAFIYWQEGVESTGLLDSKKIPSRFVEALLWEWEKHTGRRLSKGQVPLRQASMSFKLPAGYEQEPLPRTANAYAALLRLVEKGLSATALASYVGCPARFFYERLAHIQAPESIVEENDPRGVGDAVHTALATSFSQLLGKKLMPGMFKAENVQQAFMLAVHEQGLLEHLPAISRFMLEENAALRFTNFVQSLDALANDVQVTPLAVEESLRAGLAFFPNPFNLQGKVDRVDERCMGANAGTGLVILDYKTGSLPANARDFWPSSPACEGVNPELAKFWARVLPFATDPVPAFEEADMAHMRLVPASCLQLPFYVYLYSLAKQPSSHTAILDAAFVELQDTGAEVFFMGQEVESEARIFRLETCVPALIRFLCSCLFFAPHFPFHVGDACKYCPFAAFCSA